LRHCSKSHRLEQGSRCHAGCHNQVRPLNYNKNCPWRRLEHVRLREHTLVFSEFRRTRNMKLLRFAGFFTERFY
jgi:hypothetical protein